MLEVVLTKRFEKSIKRVKKRGKNLDKLSAVVESLAKEKPLEAKHRDHKLSGQYQGKRECHIEPDWLLVYQIKDGDLILADTGSHSDLFGK